MVIKCVIAYQEYLKKMLITINFQKTGLDKYATSGVSAFTTTYLFNPIPHGRKL